MHPCMYVYLYIHTYAHVTCMCRYISIYLYISLYIYVYTYVTYVCIHIHRYICRTKKTLAILNMSRMDIGLWMLLEHEVRDRTFPTSDAHAVIFFQAMPSSFPHHFCCKHVATGATFTNLQMCFPWIRGFRWFPRVLISFIYLSTYPQILYVIYIDNTNTITHSDINNSIYSSI